MRQYLTSIYQRFIDSAFKLPLLLIESLSLRARRQFDGTGFGDELNQRAHDHL
jgi:hypothetical protein